MNNFNAFEIKYNGGLNIDEIDNPHSKSDAINDYDIAYTSSTKRLTLENKEDPNLNNSVIFSNLATLIDVSNAEKTYDISYDTTNLKLFENGVLKDTENLTEKEELKIVGQNQGFRFVNSNGNSYIETGVTPTAGVGGNVYIGRYETANNPTANFNTSERLTRIYQRAIIAGDDANVDNENGVEFFKNSNEFFIQPTVNQTNKPIRFANSFKSTYDTNITQFLGDINIGNNDISNVDNIYTNFLNSNSGDLRINNNVNMESNDITNSNQISSTIINGSVGNIGNVNLKNINSNDGGNININDNTDFGGVISTNQIDIGNRGITDNGTRLEVDTADQIAYLADIHNAPSVRQQYFKIICPEENSNGRLGWGSQSRTGIYPAMKDGNSPAVVSFKMRIPNTNVNNPRYKFNINFNYWNSNNTINGTKVHAYLERDSNFWDTLLQNQPISTSGAINYFTLYYSNTNLIQDPNNWKPLLKQTGDNLNAEIVGFGSRGEETGFSLFVDYNSLVDDVKGQDIYVSLWGYYNAWSSIPPAIPMSGWFLFNTTFDMIIYNDGSTEIDHNVVIDNSFITSTISNNNTSFETLSVSGGDFNARQTLRHNNYHLNNSISNNTFLNHIDPSLNHSIEKLTGNTIEINLTNIPNINLSSIFDLGLTIKNIGGSGDLRFIIDLTNGNTNTYDFSLNNSITHNIENDEEWFKFDRTNINYDFENFNVDISNIKIQIDASLNIVFDELNLAWVDSSGTINDKYYYFKKTDFSRDLIKSYFYHYGNEIILRDGNNYGVAENPSNYSQSIKFKGDYFSGFSSAYQLTDLTEIKSNYADTNVSDSGVQGQGKLSFLVCENNLSTPQPPVEKMNIQPNKVQLLTDLDLSGKDINNLEKLNAKVIRLLNGTERSLIARPADASMIFSLVNNINSQPNNFSNGASLAVARSNNALHIGVDGVTNNRNAYIQVGHESGIFSSSSGNLFLQPFNTGSRIKIGGGTSSAPSEKLDIEGNITMNDNNINNVGALNMTSGGDIDVNGGDILNANNINLSNNLQLTNQGNNSIIITDTKNYNSANNPVNFNQSIKFKGDKISGFFSERIEELAEIKVNYANTSVGSSINQGKGKMSFLVSNSGTLDDITEKMNIQPNKVELLTDLDLSGNNINNVGALNMVNSADINLNSGDINNINTIDTNTILINGSNGRMVSSGGIFYIQAGNTGKKIIFSGFGNVNPNVLELDMSENKVKIGNELEMNTGADIDLNRNEIINCGGITFPDSGVNGIDMGVNEIINVNFLDMRSDGGNMNNVRQVNMKSVAEINDCKELNMASGGDIDMNSGDIVRVNDLCFNSVVSEIKNVNAVRFGGTGGGIYMNNSNSLSIIDASINTVATLTDTKATFNTNVSIDDNEIQNFRMGYAFVNSSTTLNNQDTIIEVDNASVAPNIILPVATLGKVLKFFIQFNGTDNDITLTRNSGGSDLIVHSGDPTGSTSLTLTDQHSNGTITYKSLELVGLSYGWGVVETNTS